MDKLLDAVWVGVAVDMEVCRYRNMNLCAGGTLGVMTLWANLAVLGSKQPSTLSHPP